MAGFNVGRTQAQPTFLQGALVGLGGTLERMALDKLAQIQQQNEQRQFAQALQGLASPEGYQFSPQQAHLVSLLPIQQRLQALQTMSPGQAPAQAPFAPSFEQEPTLTSLGQQERAQELAPEQMPAYAPTEASALQFGQEINRLNTGQPLQFTAKDVLQQAKDLGYQITPDKVRQVQERVNQFNQNPQVQQQAFQDYQRAMQAQQAQGQAPQAAAPSVAPVAPQPFFKKPLTEGEKIAQERLELARRKEERQVETEASKESKEFVQKIRSEHEAARDNRKRLNRMEYLMDHGNFGSPLRNQAIKWFEHPLGPHGPTFDVTSWMTADAQEMEKLSADFAKGAKEFFPGRVTDNDLKLYMRTVPSLMQSKAGMQRLINSMKTVSDAQDLKYNAMRAVIKANGGKRPFDLEDQVEDLVGHQLDRLANDFVKGPLVEESGLGAGVFRY